MQEFKNTCFATILVITVAGNGSNPSAVLVPTSGSCMWHSQPPQCPQWLPSLRCCMALSHFMHGIKLLPISIQRLWALELSYIVQNTLRRVWNLLGAIASIMPLCTLVCMEIRSSTKHSGVSGEHCVPLSCCTGLSPHLIFYSRLSFKSNQSEVRL